MNFPNRAMRTLAPTGEFVGLLVGQVPVPSYYTAWGAHGKSELLSSPVKMSTQNLKPQQPLTDDEASKEMKKMVAFIMQEAAEKTRELHIRADEEFNIEKAKIVHQETVAIEQQFGRKLKQAEVKRRMYDSGGSPRPQYLQSWEILLGALVLMVTLMVVVG